MGGDGERVASPSHRQNIATASPVRGGPSGRYRRHLSPASPDGHAHGHVLRHMAMRTTGGFIGVVRL